MKKLSIISLLVIIMMGAVGCSDWLDVKPESEIILDEYWKKEADVDAVVASCYMSLTESNVIARMIVWGELRSDNLTSGISGVGTLDLYRILQGNLTPTNSYCSWSSFYTVINYCNTLLHYAPYVCDRDENFTQADLAQAKSEALAIRALAYFYLVRSFKEVPWMDEASISDNQDFNKPKSSEEFILNNIISDLKYAEENITSDYGKTSYNKGRFTKSGVQALLADIYLWENDYKNCISECDKVFQNKKLELETAKLSFSHIFYFGNSTESIFELQFDDKNQINSSVKYFFGSSTYVGELSFPTTLTYNPYTAKAGAYSPFYYKVSSSVIESEKDIRAKDSYMVLTNRIFKYVGVSRTDNAAGTDGSYTLRTTTPNWIVYRLADIFLMKAEALVELDSVQNLKSALSLVNKTYARSNDGQDTLVYANYSSKSEMQKLVLRERQRELLFEGKRWYDLVRMARRENSTSSLSDFVDHKSSGNSVTLGAPVMNAMYMPISKSELESNSKLVQNPYYVTNDN